MCIINSMRKTKISISLLVILFIIFLVKGTEGLPKELNQTISTILTPTVSPSSLVTPTRISSVSGAMTEETVVTKVVDGDTIEVTGKRKVRLIGIDTPETVDPRRGVQCFGKEASAHTKELLLNKTIRMERDVSETDKYGRLLRYIFIGDILVNEQLVKDGYAKASTYPPDVKYQARFKQAELLAQTQNKGLWGKCP